MLAASTAPSAAPAPTSICISSMKRMQLPAPLSSSMTFFRRSSNSPRYLVPATSEPMSSVTRRRLRSISGTSLRMMRWASASTMAVLPTPGSPIRTGLFLVRRERICTTRSISFSRPMTGSSLLARAAAVRSMPSWSTVGVRVAEAAGLIYGELDDLLGAGGEADFAHNSAVSAADDELDGGADLVEFDAQVGEDFGGDAFTLAHEAEEEVFSAYVVVVEAEGFLLGKCQDAPGSLGELVESVGHLSVPAL